MAMLLYLKINVSPAFQRRFVGVSSTYNLSGKNIKPSRIDVLQQPYTDMLS